MKRFISGLVVSALAALLLATTTGTANSAVAATASSPAPLRPVARVDLDQYVGQWYQLAAVPAIYEVQCARDVTATYTANDDGTIGVRNACQTWFGNQSVVDGTARVDNAPRNSALTVSFFSLGGKPVYSDSSNYLVFARSADYRWALVGDPHRRSGFVLSRTPSLPAGAVARIRRTITAAGYDLCDFHGTPQTGGSSDAGPIC